MAHKYTPESLLGFPFQELPGNPPEHKVLEEFVFPGGTVFKIKAGAVMMVFNDAVMMDAINGEGCYFRSYLIGGEPRHKLQVYVYRLAVKLYGGPPDIERYMPCEHRGVRFEARVGRVEPETGKEKQ